MIEELFTVLSNALYESFWIALIASFGWGVLSILLSPCHLSSIPLVVGFIAAQGKITLSRTLYISIIFSLGILITIAAVGIVTAAAGRLMGDVGTTGNYIVAAIFFIVGLWLMDIINIDWNTAGLNRTKSAGLPGALILGLLFGAALGPCTFAYAAPVLGIVFQTASTNFTLAGLFLLAFGMGHCLVIVAAGTLTQKVQRYLNWSEGSKVILRLKHVCGILVILGGIYLILNAG